MIQEGIQFHSRSGDLNLYVDVPNRDLWLSLVCIDWNCKFVEHYFIFVAIILFFFGIADYFSTDFVHAIFVCRNLTFITFK